jgi:hypothetical protein
MRPRLLPATLVIGLLAPVIDVTVQAHHSHAMFDLSKEVTLTGTISKVLFRNPHVMLILDVKGPDGQTVSWTVEMSTIEIENRRGTDSINAQTWRCDHRETESPPRWKQGRQLHVAHHGGRQDIRLSHENAYAACRRVDCGHRGGAITIPIRPPPPLCRHRRGRTVARHVQQEGGGRPERSISQPGAE